jgi:hypothetical protein
MKKTLLPSLIMLGLSITVQSQTNQAIAPSTGAVTRAKASVKAQNFIMIHKEKDSPFEIYQDLVLDELVIRLKNQFDVLRFEIRDQNGKSMAVKGIQERTEVHAPLKDLPNGTYRLIVDRNKEKIFTEFLLDRD